MTIELLKPWRHWAKGERVDTLTDGVCDVLIRNGTARKADLVPVRKVLADTPSDKSRSRTRKAATA